MEFTKTQKKIILDLVKKNHDFLLYKTNEYLEFIFSVTGSRIQNPVAEELNELLEIEEMIENSIDK